MEAMEAIHMILEAAAPLIMVVLVVYVAGEAIGLIKKAIGVR